MTAALLLTALTLPAAAEEPKRLTVVVTETAGLRRFGYPVEAVLPLPADQAGRCRLLADGNPVGAQFRPGLDGKGVVLDFSTSLGPLEKRAFVVESGPNVTAGPEPTRGLRLEKAEGVLRIQHTANQVYELPADLRGLLRSVRGGAGDYLRPGSVGLTVRTRDGKTVQAGGPGTTAEVIRSGPLAVAVRFTGPIDLGGRPARAVAEITVPASKSWVRIDWRVIDRQDVAGLGLDVNLNVASAPTLVDFGASSMVYTTLKRGEKARLRTDDRGDWAIETGPADRLTRFAQSTRTRPAAGSNVDPFDRHTSPLSQPVVEGWAHVMDRQRCTALAVAEFAQSPGSEIGAEADGRTSVWLTGKPQLTCWLHFVSMPVQVGALTSPQSMLAPLKVEVKDH